MSTPLPLALTRDSPPPTTEVSTTKEVSGTPVRGRSNEPVSDIAVPPAGLGTSEVSGTAFSTLETSEVSGTVVPALGISEVSGTGISGTGISEVSGTSGGRFGRFRYDFKAMVALVFAISFAKTIRLPNLWAATHMTFNYSHGFVRRGLVGQLLQLVAGERAFHYQPLALFGIGLFLAVVVAMVIHIRRAVAVDREDAEYWIAIILLGASPGTVFFVHEIGYFDYIGVLALLGVLHLGTRSRNRFLLFPAVALVGLVLAFIHEILVTMFVPTMFFTMVCLVVSELRATPASRATWIRGSLAAVVAALIPFAASATVGTIGTKPPAVIHAMKESISRHVDFPLRNDAFDVLSKPFRDVLLKQMPFHWSFRENRAYLIAGFVAIAPSLAFLLFYGLRVLMRVRTTPAARASMMTTFVAATVAPLFLNFVGWDNARWNAIAVIDGFGCIGAMRLFFGAEVAAGAPDSSRLTLALGTAAIALGLCTSYNNFLFDGYTVRWFPFAEPLRWR